MANLKTTAAGLVTAGGYAATGGHGWLHWVVSIGIAVLGILAKDA
jgi:hypothetical protein